MNTVLLVEDDKDIQKINKEMLERRGGYNVCLAMNLAEARKQVNKVLPGIIVLDITLPDGNGLDFLWELRSTASSGAVADIPVLLLTALDEPDDIVRGLEAGGDDYLAKPYDNDVLLARIGSLLRRAERIPKNLTKGPLTLDLVSGRAFVKSDESSSAGDNAQDLLLTQKEFAILFLLVQNEESILSAQSIYENVWKLPLGDDRNTLQMTISNLRKKIDPSGYTIAVSRGQGYAFERI